MNQSSFRLFNHSARLLLAALSCLPFGGACSSDEAAPTTPTTFAVEITTLDGISASEPIALRCDQGGPTDASVEAGVGGASEAVPGAFSTLVVAVSLTPTELTTKFVLRPAHACGTSARCGYIRLEALDDAGQVLTSVDTVTTEGVLQLQLAQLPTQIRASLINGVNQKPLLNPDESKVTTSVTPSFVVPSACAVDVPSGGGAGGEGPTPVGGAGAGGESSTPSAGGAGGETAEPGFGGASGAGGADSANSGAGGA